MKVWVWAAADWSEYGRGAGLIRNEQMLDEGKPELVNEDCWKAWMIVIAPADAAGDAALMDAAAYSTHVKESAH